MISFLIEQQLVNALQDKFANKTIHILNGVRKMAAQQGGDSAIENYQLLGKRVLIVAGVAVVAVQAVSFVLARRSEEKRIERVVHRVLEEERQKEEEAKA